MKQVFLLILFFLISSKLGYTQMYVKFDSDIGRFTTTYPLKSSVLRHDDKILNKENFSYDDKNRLIRYELIVNSKICEFSEYKYQIDGLVITHHLLCDESKGVNFESVRNNNYELPKNITLKELNDITDLIYREKYKIINDSIFYSKSYNQYIIESRSRSIRPMLAKYDVKLDTIFKTEQFSLNSVKVSKITKSDSLIRSFSVINSRNNDIVFSAQMNYSYNGKDTIRDLIIYDALGQIVSIEKKVSNKSEISLVKKSLSSSFTDFQTVFNKSDSGSIKTKISINSTGHIEKRKSTFDLHNNLTSFNKYMDGKLVEKVIIENSYYKEK